MITLDFSTTMVGLDGKNLRNGDREIQMHTVVADTLSKSGEGEPMKLYDLATRIWKDAKIAVDESDFDTIRTAVLKSDLMPLFKAPIVRQMDNCKAKK